MANWEEWQPRVTLPGKVEGRRLSERMRVSARGADEGSQRVLLYFAGQVRELEAVKGPLHYQSLMGGALLGFLAGVVLALMVAQ